MAFSVAEDWGLTPRTNAASKLLGLYILQEQTNDVSSTVWFNLSETVRSAKRRELKQKKVL